MTKQEIIDYVCTEGRYNDVSNPKYQYYVRWNGRAVFAEDPAGLVKKLNDLLT